MPSVRGQEIVNIDMFFSDFEARAGRMSKIRSKKSRVKLGFLPMTKKMQSALAMQDLNRQQMSNPENQQLRLAPV